MCWCLCPPLYLPRVTKPFPLISCQVMSKRVGPKGQRVSPSSKNASLALGLVQTQTSGQERPGGKWQCQATHGWGLGQCGHVTLDKFLSPLGTPDPSLGRVFYISSFWNIYENTSHCRV